jgi:hypothetical protein
MVLKPGIHPNFGAVLAGSKILGILEGPEDVSNVSDVTS